MKSALYSKAEELLSKLSVAKTDEKKTIGSRKIMNLIKENFKVSEEDEKKIKEILEKGKEPKAKITQVNLSRADFLELENCLLKLDIKLSAEAFSEDKLDVVEAKKELAASRKAFDMTNMKKVYQVGMTAAALAEAAAVEVAAAEKFVKSVENKKRSETLRNAKEELEKTKKAVNAESLSKAAKVSVEDAAKYLKQLDTVAKARTKNAKAK